jgi:hypothetical protein
MANTGENEQALRKIIDFIRLLSIIILLLHFYFFCYPAFKIWGLTSALFDHLLLGFYRTGWFNGACLARVMAFGLLVVSLIGAKGKKDEKLALRNALLYINIGALLFFLGHFVFLTPMGMTREAVLYIIVVSLGYLLMLAGGTWLSRLIKVKFRKDIFNKLNESFPQEERLLENEYSINLPAAYDLKGTRRKSWIKRYQSLQVFAGDRDTRSR